MSNHSSLVKIATFDCPVLAHLARNKLELAGIATFLDGEHHVAMDWLISNAIGGIKLLVANEDQEKAVIALHESFAIDSNSSTESTAKSGYEKVLSCPKCNSLSTCREKLKRKLIFVSILLLGIPLPFFSRKIVCYDCGYKWLFRENSLA